MCGRHFCLKAGRRLLRLGVQQSTRKRRAKSEIGAYQLKMLDKYNIGPLL